MWQSRNDKYVLIRLFSRALTPTQTNYSATEREMLGYVISLLKFDKYLKHKHFILIGDHQPMLSLFNINIESKNKKLLRYIVQLSDYDFLFEHHAGKSITFKLEDYLSRLAYPTETPSETASLDEVLNCIEITDGYTRINIGEESIIAVLHKLEVVTFEERERKDTKDIKVKHLYSVDDLDLIGSENTKKKYINYYNLKMENIKDNYGININVKEDHGLDLNNLDQLKVRKGNNKQFKLCDFRANSNHNPNIEAIKRYYELENKYDVYEVAIVAED